MKEEGYKAGATLMKTKSSRAGTMLMKRRAPEPELRHFYDSSTALVFIMIHVTVRFISIALIYSK